jgi:DNA-binding Lrp family transcriptional regulator
VKRTPVVAYVLVNMKPGTSHDIVSYRKIHGVKISNSVFGRYDAVLVISAKNMEELSKTIYDVVEKHPEVEHTECLVTIPYPPEERPHPPPETHTIISFNCPICDTLNRQDSVSCQFCGFLFSKSR